MSDMDRQAHEPNRGCVYAVLKLAALWALWAVGLAVLTALLR